MSCVDMFINIANSTSLSFYSNCSSLEFVVGPSHEFSGAFSLPGVLSIGKFVAGYLFPHYKGDTRVDDAVTTISMPDLVNTKYGGIFLGYLENLTSINFP